jgi:hypothetical protein
MHASGILLLLVSLLSPQAGQQDSDAIIDNDTSMIVELDHALDVKRLKSGDKFTAQLLDDVISHGKLLVPHKKAKIIGRVVAALPRSQKNEQSRLVLAFDRIMIDGGADVRVKAVIVEMAPYHHAPLSGPSVPTSGDDPMARAAGPKADANGIVLIPTHPPITQQGPTPKSVKQSGASKIDGVSIDPDYRVLTTALNADKKDLKLDRWTQMTLTLNPTRQKY